MNTLLIDVRQAAFLPLLNEMVHDQGFTLPRVTHDPESGIVEIPFALNPWQIPGAKRRWRHKGPDLRAKLHVHDVERLSLVDTHGVEANELNMIAFDEDQRVVTVHTSVPTDFNLMVATLRIALTVESVE